MQFGDFRFRPTHTYEGRPVMQLSSWTAYNISNSDQTVIRRCMFEDRTVIETADRHFVPLLDASTLLKDLREECRDWQDALSGERPELDDVCGRVDEFLGSV